MHQPPVINRRPPESRRIRMTINVYCTHRTLHRMTIADLCPDQTVTYEQP
jgi:hypothetical protein